MDMKPKLKLIGKNGNSFMILGFAQQAAKKAGWDKEKIAAFMKEATTGNYDHLLQTCFKYFDIS